MKLIDTSAWIEFLNATGSPEGQRLREAISEREVIVVDPILSEVMAGARREAVARTQRLLEAQRLEALFPKLDWLDAATIYRELRWRGVTIRSQDLRPAEPPATSARKFGPARVGFSPLTSWKYSESRIGVTSIITNDRAFTARDSSTSCEDFADLRSPTLHHPLHHSEFAPCIPLPNNSHANTSFKVC